MTGRRLAVVSVLLAVAVPASQLVGQQAVAKTQYVSLCAPCHGESGRGNGPAAVGLTPRPRNFAEPGFLAERTDQDLIAMITNGKGSMPAFKPQLSARQIAQLAAYIRGFAKPRK